MTEPSFDPRKTLVFEKDGLMEARLVTFAPERCFGRL